MKYYELNRVFVPLTDASHENLGFEQLWGDWIPNAISWPKLIEQWRVVLLAEAGCGKSAEFHNQVELIQADGRYAFYARVEDLADTGVEAAIEPSLLSSLTEWLAGKEECWFFLDSVDEARVNRKSFEVALRNFARVLEGALDRVHVLISCRFTDWKAEEDPAVIGRLIPCWRHTEDQAVDSDHALLGPIFDEESSNRTELESVDQGQLENIKVVTLVPLLAKQRRLLAAFVEVPNVNDFMLEIQKNNLESFAERPADLIELAHYWKTRGKFDSLERMMEYGIEQKLLENSASRPDAEVLSPIQARRGAERIAAALTLAKSFILQSADRTSSFVGDAEVMHAAQVLTDWSTAQQAALLRRGIFVPASYGRVRFHHRSTQEYLTACWFRKLLKDGCPISEIHNVVFSERYGIKTIVPSLRAAVAWLAVWDSEICEEIIRREPIILLKQGVSGSLPIAVRRKLLLSYATKHASGEVSNDDLDHRSLWILAHQDLAEAIFEAWELNERADFRIDLLRVIREGKIRGCVPILRTIVNKRSVDKYEYIVAIEALRECGDRQTLEKIAKELVVNAAHVPDGALAYVCKSLFPEYVCVQQLLNLIESTSTATEEAGDDDDELLDEDGDSGFSYNIVEIYRSCENRHQQEQLTIGLADICLSEPFISQYERVSRKHKNLARQLKPIAHVALTVEGSRVSDEALVPLLMVIERTQSTAYLGRISPTLDVLVRQNTNLVRRLFWADVEEICKSKEDNIEPIRFWQLHLNAEQLWSISEQDLSWLIDDLTNRPITSDRRIALSAIQAILVAQGNLEKQESYLRSIIGQNKDLSADLDTYIHPAPAAPVSRPHVEKLKAQQMARENQIKTNKESWRKFRDSLLQNPAVLNDPDRIRTWKAGAYRLSSLTNWLARRVRKDINTAVKHWRLLSEGFDKSTAEAYHEGMKLLWRLTKPERPLVRENGTTTTKWTTILATGAIGMEAAEDPKWTSRLSIEEANTAMSHGLLSGHGYSNWMHDLLEAFPDHVTPYIAKRIRVEIRAPENGQSALLYHYAKISKASSFLTSRIILEALTNVRSENPNRVDLVVRILIKLSAYVKVQRRLLIYASRSFSRDRNARNHACAVRYLALIMSISFDDGVRLLEDWLESATPGEQKNLAEMIFPLLFGRRDALVDLASSSGPATSLQRLIVCAYRYIRVDSDRIHSGSYTPDQRDDAEEARHVVLSALLDRPGIDAYRAFSSLANEPVMLPRRIRYLELARSKAERDSECLSWAPNEVDNFFQRHTAPVKSGADLYRVVCTEILAIGNHLRSADTSTRKLLCAAEHEDDVQNWLTEQLVLRSRGRYHVHREAQIQRGDKPDIIVSSTSHASEVAIEVKHGGKKWSANDLARALRVQLADKYLKSERRRYGILLVTNHSSRIWKNPVTGIKMNFDSVVGWLNELARGILVNKFGGIEVACLGIDAKPLE